LKRLAGSVDLLNQKAEYKGIEDSTGRQQPPEKLGFYFSGHSVEYY
jgi:hypothetical protein